LRVLAQPQGPQSARLLKRSSAGHDLLGVGVSILLRPPIGSISECMLIAMVQKIIGIIPRPLDHPSKDQAHQNATPKTGLAALQRAA
jgi:hypothetical protein